MKKKDDYRDISGDWPHGFFVHDEQGRFIDVNEQSCIDLGYSREELLALTINDISSGGAPDENIQKWKSAPPGLAMTFREIALRKDGSTYPVDINLTCQVMGDRKVFVGLARQLGDRTLRPSTNEVTQESRLEFLWFYRNRDLLTRFNVIATADPEKSQQEMLRVFGATQLSLPSGPSNIQVNIASLTDIDLIYMSTSADLIYTIPAIDRFCIQFSLNGRATTNMEGAFHEVDERRACTVPPQISSDGKLYGGHRRLALRISPDVLKRKLGALIGKTLIEDITIDTSLDMTLERSQHLLRTSLFLAETLTWSSTAHDPSLALRELEQAVVVAALEATPSIASKLLQGPALITSPHHVRIVEEYLNANWNRLVSIEELVTISGVGMRTLFRSFNQHRGQSPMQFARLVRLRRAHAILSAPKQDTTVLGTALACGYSNPGHFARHYFNAFGERPYQTLARHR